MTIITISKPFDKDFLLAQLQEHYPNWGRDWVTENADGSYTLTLPDGVDSGTAQIIIDSHRANLIALNQIIQLAQSAVSVALVDLTQAQIKALFAVVLFRLGGVDPSTLKVLPLNLWA